MNRTDFLSELKKGLSGLPAEDIEERLAFYAEMIDDRVEEGLTETEAIEEIGPVCDVVSQILSETPLTKLVKEKVKTSRGLKGWEVILLILGSPIWLSLLIAAASIVFSAYITIWSLLIALWAVAGSVAACAVGCVGSSVIFYLQGHILTGIAMLGGGIFFVGLSILLFIGCGAASRAMGIFTKKIVFSIKALFVGREDIK